MAEQTIKIDNKEYKLDDLTEGAKAQLVSIHAVDAEVKRLQMQLAICQTAKNAYSAALQQELAPK